jgi:2-polyprenyl-6-methoxyphenol hydroxylase-like FAD-dependent oxidoreductase
MGKRLIRDYWQPNQRFGVVPVTEQTVYWAAAWVVSRPDRQSFTIQDLTMRFRDWPIQELLSHVEAHSLQTIFVHDIDPLPKWNQGKLLLLGDSAHAPLPTSGQGASQAIEDAWCLCQLLKESQSLDWIFHEFFSLRSQHTTRVQLLGRRLAQDLFPHAEDNDQIHSDSI